MSNKNPARSQQHAGNANLIYSEFYVTNNIIIQKYKMSRGKLK